MIFSAHVVDSGPIKALARRMPEPSNIEGLLSARTAICASFTSGVVPRPQFKRETMIACWEDDAAIDSFLAERESGQVFAKGWQARMGMFRGLGIWPGLDQDLQSVVQTSSAPETGPVIGVTIGTFYVRSIL